MLKLDKLPEEDCPTRVYAFDLEWTKNYHVKNGNQPFCFSLVWVPTEQLPLRVDEKLRFGVAARYVESRSEIPRLLKEADRAFRRFLDDGAGRVLVGHQLSSDISVILNHPDGGRLTHVTRMKQLWRSRAGDVERPVVFDTRYDLTDGFVRCKSRRLVDVCSECNLDVQQPELVGSMTRMQNRAFSMADTNTIEKLLTLNIRHSLSSLIVYLYTLLSRRRRRRINVNRILHCNLSGCISYLQSSAFQHLLRGESATAP